MGLPRQAPRGRERCGQYSTCLIWRATRGPVSLLLLVTSCTMAQSPRFSLSEQKQLQERERLIKQVDELRRAGKLDEAVAAAERALELRAPGRGERAESKEAETLSRLAELRESRGDWDRALARRKEAFLVCERVRGRNTGERSTSGWR